MKFRRSRPVLEGYHLQPYTYRYDPTSWVLPQEWRNRDDAEEIFLVPLEFVLRFADREYLEWVRRVEECKVAVLRDSMVVEGLKVPMELRLDPHGKLRFHDGYHRLVVATERPDLFPSVPVKLERSSGRIRGYGRNMFEEADFILSWISRWRP